MIRFVRHMRTIEYVEVWDCDTCGQFMHEYVFGYFDENGHGVAHPEHATVINKPQCTACGDISVGESQ